MMKRKLKQWCQQFHQIYQQTTALVLFIYIYLQSKREKREPDSGVIPNFNDNDQWKSFIPIRHGNEGIKSFFYS
jgi:hypothetical protein